MSVQTLCCRSGPGAGWSSSVDAAVDLGTSVTVAAAGIGNVFVPDLTGYATQSWVTHQVNAAIAALDDLSEESF